MTQRSTYRAYAWRTGAIDIANGRTPAGAIKLFTFKSRRAALVGTRVIETQARLAYDNKTLLVPGVPEADGDDRALDALVTFAHRTADRLARRLPKRSFVSEIRA